MIPQKTLVNFLKRKQVNTGLINTLKIVYRPFICPFSELMNIVPPQSKIMDIGCGSGQFALLLAEFLNPAAIGGIEISQELINNANELLDTYKNKTDINFFVFNGQTLPDIIQEYEYIFMIDIIHHIPVSEQTIFINNLYKKMKPGAILILKDIDATSPLVVFNKLHDLLLAKQISRELSFTNTFKILESAGFKIKSTSKKRMFWYPHFTIICEK